MTERFDIGRTAIPDGQTLIEASAGTGKTFALTRLVVRLVIEGHDLRKILLVTFTIAATEELKTRLRDALREALARLSAPDQIGEDDDLYHGLLARIEEIGSDPAEAVARLRAALQVVDESGVFTIHGFCKRVLEQAAFESGAPFAAEVADEAPELFERAVTDFWHRHTYDDPLLAALCVDLDEKELREHYTLATRFPGTRLVPEPGAIEALTRDLDTALDAAREEWEDRGEGVLRAVKWKKSSGFADQAAAARAHDQVAAALRGEVAGNLRAFACFTPQRVTDGGYARGDDGRRTTAAAEHPVCIACERVADVVTALEAAVIQRYVTEVGRRYDRLRAEAGVLTFDDLLRRVHAALAPESPARDALRRSIQHRWSHALIDEFQDTDPIQYDIFRWAFDGCPLVFVGDPKQSIYSFRGADLFAYIDAKKSAGAEYALGTNWRSSEPLVRAVNALFGHVRHPFLIPEIGYHAVDAAAPEGEQRIAGDDLPPLIWWYLPLPEGRTNITKGDAARTVISGTVAEIQRLTKGEVTIDGEPIEPRQIAVLVRGNREAIEVAEALRRAGIPSVVSTDADIWSSAEVADLEFVLRGILRPQDRRAVRTALATDLWGWDAARIQDLDHEEDRATAVSERLREWQHAWREHGVLHALRRFIDEEGVAERLLRLRDGERRMTNLRHAVELLHQAEAERQRGPEELLHWLRGRENRRLMTKEESELRLESDAAAVQVATIHKSKGLQYDVVFAPMLWSARTPFGKQYPLVYTDDGFVYDLGSADLEHHRALAQAEELAEELRLAYVALTRARHRCYTAWGAVNQAEASPLGYLFLGHDAARAGGLAEFVRAVIEHARDRLATEAKPALDRVIEEAGDVMAIQPTPELYGPRRADADGQPPDLHPRRFPDDQTHRLLPWTLTSFSGLTAAAFEDLDHTAAEQESPPDDLPLLAFAAGRQAGLCLHAILEDVDFTQTGPGTGGNGDLKQLIDRKLRQFNLDRPEHHRRPINPAETVTSLVADLAGVPLPLGGGTLADLTAARQIREWRFVLPVRAASPRQLARAFAEHGVDGLADYPALLERLDGDALARYLSGFADLVFESGGRWFVYDWKSNLLGNALADYAPDRLAATALSHHYELQLHLYTLALHRYLRTRLPDYDYDRHVGGAAVVFLRGVQPGTASGFHARRPGRELIGALEEGLCR